MKTIIEINDDVAKVVTHNVDGTQNSKSISINDLCTAMSNIARQVEIEVPPGCRKVMKCKDKEVYLFVAPQFIGNALVTWYDGDSESFGKLSEYIPKKEDNISTNREYNNDRIRLFHVPYPATAVMVVVRRNPNGTFTFLKMYCFALKNVFDSISTMKAYHWPYTNVFTSGECCIGNIAYEYPSIESLASIPRCIFNGVCNHDLANSTVININGENGVAPLGSVRDSFELLVRARDQKAFPVEYLKPIGEVNSLMKGIMANWSN